MGATISTMLLGDLAVAGERHCCAGRVCAHGGLPASIQGLGAAVSRPTVPRYPPLGIGFDSIVRSPLTRRALSEFGNIRRPSRTGGKYADFRTLSALGASVQGGLPGQTGQFQSSALSWRCQARRQPSKSPSTCSCRTSFPLPFHAGGLCLPSACAELGCQSSFRFRAHVSCQST